jgi:hypothetical protein
MSDKELVKRLVDWSEHDEGKINDARQEAADRIDALTAERDDYAFRLADANNTYSEMHVALNEANDKLAKAVEALDDLLEAITAEDRFGDRSLTITGPTANLKWLLETEEEARATLAEIAGEKT